ncbi:MAG: hypothetical protein OHK0024_06670 [Thalassobaculales bacterium]
MSGGPAGAVLVSHPGTSSLLYELVAAVAASGRPTLFETGVFLADGHPLGRLVGRRRRPGLRLDDLRLHPFLELPFLAASRLGLAAGPMLAWRNRRFDRAVARRVARERPAVLIGAETASAESFAAARRAGTVAILNQVIGAARQGLATLEAAAARHPDFADGVDFAAMRRFLAAGDAEAGRADLILVPSAYVRDTLLAEGVPAAKLRLVPYGVAVDRFRPVARPGGGGPLRALFLGQIGLRKGVPDLLAAMRLLAPGLVALTLAGPVIGRGLARHAGLFTYRPPVPHAAVDRLFAEADVFVLPSLHEGSAMVILEAMASGLPIVTTANAGSPVSDGVEGFIVPVGDAEALAGRLALLAGDPALRARMGAAARATAERHDWPRYRAAIAAVLAEAAP